MKRQSKRKYPRIPYRGRVDLIFGEQRFTECESKNLCLSGLWVSGCLDRQEGERCEVAFRENTATPSRPLRLKAQVVRRDKGGIALIFLDMNMRNYTDLQNLIQERGVDPFTEADAFLDQI